MTAAMISEMKEIKAIRRELKRWMKIEAKYERASKRYDKSFWAWKYEGGSEEKMLKDKAYWQKCEGEHRDERDRMNDKLDAFRDAMNGAYIAAILPEEGRIEIMDSFTLGAYDRYFVSAFEAE